MKSPIESLLTLRRWEEDEARNLFVLAKKELVGEEERLAKLERDFAALREGMEERSKAASSIDEIRQAQQCFDHLMLLLKLQRDSVAKSAMKLEEAARVMAAAAMERKKFEKVDDRQKQARRREVGKREERNIDEHAVLRYKKDRAG
jgi:flagellar export protein FliJ